jgi:hypothetical protein
MDALTESEKFTVDEFIPALAKGGFIDEAKKKEIAAKVSRYSGLSEKTVLQHNLIVPVSYFWKDLLREKGLTIGRLDSRYLGIDRQQAGDSPDYNYSRHQLLSPRCIEIQNRLAIQHVWSCASMG